MNQLTLRHIPLPIEKRLRDQARKDGMSINKTVVAILANALGVSEHVAKKRKRDLSRFIGTLKDSHIKEFEENTRAFEAIDKDMWKS